MTQSNIDGIISATHQLLSEIKLTSDPFSCDHLEACRNLDSAAMGLRNALEFLALVIISLAAGNRTSSSYRRVEAAIMDVKTALHRIS